MGNQQNPSAAIVAHHAEMIRELRARVDGLIAAVGRGDPCGAAVTSITDYLDGTIFPHAAGEEATLYAAASPFEHRLVESLLLEHAALRDLRTKLDRTREHAARVAIAGAIIDLFALHADKENRFVLPALLENPAVDLGELLSTMHGEFERNQPLPDNHIEQSVTIPVVELENIATLVLEGLRIRAADTVTITDADAVASWEHLDGTLLPGQVGHDEPAWLASVLLAVADEIERTTAPVEAV